MGLLRLPTPQVATGTIGMSDPTSKPSTKAASITGHFHRINRLLPDEQDVLTFSPETKVREAIARMEQLGYSQVPVVLNGSVLGVFSFRSFSRGVLEMTRERVAPGELAVEVFLEPFPFTHVSTELSAILPDLEKHNAVLVGDPERLQGIVTSSDVTRYLFKMTRPFLLLSEIELALRDLIRRSVSEEDLRQCAELSLSEIYKEGSLPLTLEAMTFNDYAQLIGDGRSWPRFASALGGTREMARAKLEQVRELRNDVFHFKRELTAEDCRRLNVHRDWLLLRARAVEAKERG